MASPSAVFTEMVTTTQRNWASKLADNVSEHNALLRAMKKKGNIKTESGGYEIALPLEYAENGTYQRYAGYEELDTDASDVLTTAKYEWRQAALHVTCSGREIRMNMGSEERMIDLVEARKNVALKTAANNLSVDLYSDGSLDNQIGGLAHGALCCSLRGDQRRQCTDPVGQLRAVCFGVAFEFFCVRHARPP